MTHIRDVLDQEMGTPPPSTVDVDEIIARQRRRLRLRQTAFGVSSGALVVGVTAIVTTVVGSTGGGQHPAPVADGSGATKHPAPQTTHPTIARKTPAATADPGAATRAAEAQRLSGVLTKLMHRALPHATFSPNPLEDALGEPFAGPFEFTDMKAYFVAGAKVTDPAGVSNVIVRVGKTDDAFVQEHGCMTDPAPLDLKVTCTSTQLGGGSYLVFMTTKRGAFKRDLAEIVRPGGLVVDVEIANSVHYYKADRPTLNLTPAQLKAMATDPHLATTP